MWVCVFFKNFFNIKFCFKNCTRIKKPRRKYYTASDVEPNSTFDSSPRVLLYSLCHIFFMEYSAFRHVVPVFTPRAAISIVISSGRRGCVESFGIVRHVKSPGGKSDSMFSPVKALGFLKTLWTLLLPTVWKQVRVNWRPQTTHREVWGDVMWWYVNNKQQESGE